MELPPPDEIPEERLRTKIIIEARSPVDGQPLDVSEYAQLQEKLQVSPPPELSNSIRESVYLLQLRKFLRQIFPFLNL